MNGQRRLEQTVAEGRRGRRVEGEDKKVTERGRGPLCPVQGKSGGETMDEREREREGGGRERERGEERGERREREGREREERGKREREEERREREEEERGKERRERGENLFVESEGPKPQKFLSLMIEESPRKSLVKGERFVRHDDTSELPSIGSPVQ